MHTTLTGIAERTVGSGRLVNQSLLDDGAVDGESEGSRLGGFGGCGGGDQGLEDGVLEVSASFVAAKRGALTLTIICEFQVPTFSWS